MHEKPHRLEISGKISQRDLNGVSKGHTVFITGSACVIFSSNLAHICQSSKLLCLCCWVCRTGSSAVFWRARQKPGNTVPRKPRRRGLSSSPGTWGSSPGCGPQSPCRRPLCRASRFVQRDGGEPGPRVMPAPCMAARRSWAGDVSVVICRLSRPGPRRPAHSSPPVPTCLFFQEPSGLGAGGVGLQEKLVAELSLQLLLGKERLEGG